MQPLTKTIKLSQPILFGEDNVRQITLREPTWQTVTDLGYPSQWMQSGDSVSLVTYPSLIAKYAEACVRPVDHFQVLAMLPLSDTLAVHEAILDFFQQARAASSRNSGGDSPAPSSSTTAAA